MLLIIAIKKGFVDLLKRNLKQIKVENLNDEDKAWYYYFRVTKAYKG